MKILQKIMKRMWLKRHKYMRSSSFERMKHFSSGSVNLQLDRCMKGAEVRQMRERVTRNRLSLS